MPARFSLPAYAWRRATSRARASTWRTRIDDEAAHGRVEHLGLEVAFEMGQEGVDQTRIAERAMARRVAHGRAKPMPADDRVERMR